MVQFTTHTPAVGSRVMADIVVAWPGVTSREQCLVVRVLDAETILVKIEASLATPEILLGQHVAIPTHMVRAYLDIFNRTAS